MNAVAEIESSSVAEPSTDVFVDRVFSVLDSPAPSETGHHLWADRRVVPEDGDAIDHELVRLANLVAPVEVAERGSGAYYRPRYHDITVPHPARFHNRRDLWWDEAWSYVLLHEVGHAARPHRGWASVLKKSPINTIWRTAFVAWLAASLPISVGLGEAGLESVYWMIIVSYWGAVIAIMSNAEELVADGVAMSLAFRLGILRSVPDSVAVNVHGHASWMPKWLRKAVIRLVKAEVELRVKSIHEKWESACETDTVN